MDARVDDYRGLWVVVPAEGAGVPDAGARLLGVARRLADQQGTVVTAVIPGAPGAAAAAGAAAIAYGADAVLRLHDAHLAGGHPAAWSAALATAATAGRPALILFADGAFARAVAPRLAARLGCGLVSAAEPATLDLDPTSGTLLATRREWGGRLLTTYAQPTARPQIVTVRTAAAPSPYADEWRAGSSTAADLSAVSWPPDPPAAPAPAAPAPPAPAANLAPNDLAAEEMIAVRRALRGARCVVVGGRGLGDAAGFARVPALAAALRGEWAATRGAIDAGWAPPAREIGLYGATVTPDLYIGCGVSGSAQHVVGMQQARTVVAIHSDPQAPIFRWAHFAIVADCTALLDHLLDRLGAGSTGSA